MNDDRNATMAEALRLTRDGRLMEATALLQQGLGGPANLRQPSRCPLGACTARPVCLEPAAYSTNCRPNCR